MASKYNRKGSKVPLKKETIPAVKKTVTRPRISLKVSSLHFIPLCLALLVFMILWFKPYKVNLTDPWNEGGMLIDSAAKVSDPIQRNKLLEDAHNILADQLQKHPYHARIHYMHGFYWFMNQNWDSAIFEQKEAIRIGAGGTVNQVEFAAQEILNSALTNKVTPLVNAGNFKEAADALENAKTPKMYNPFLDKQRGIIYSRQGNIDSALHSFLRYNAAKPNEVDILTNIASSYNQKNMRDSALTYINQALKIDPNNANANFIKSQLNRQ